MVTREQTVAREMPDFWLAFLRMAIGIAWLAAAIEKVLDSTYEETMLRPTLAQWATIGQGPINAFVTNDLLPNVASLSFALKGFEVLIGVSLILGIGTRLGAFGGFAILAGAWVFRHGFDYLSGYAGADFIAMIAMLFLVLAPSTVLAVDTVLVRRRFAARRPVTAPPVVPPPPAVGSAVS